MLITVLLAGPLNSAISQAITIIPGSYINDVSPAIPTMTLFGGLYLVWNKYIWRYPVISRFTEPPDLNGEWIGGLQSSYQSDLDEYRTDGGSTVEGPRIVIDQTWTRISVTAYFKDSTSVSTTASFIQDMSDPVLRITYRNMPDGQSEDSMVMHTGTNDLRYRTDQDMEMLEGKYYTDEHRNNHGSIRLRKKD
uniref:Cap15 family cyclic dinucleotide receptor domain-containing protein n=1 Tax=Halosimplex carlsbadense TaxID=171164 RepID=UPI00373AE625